MQLIVALLMSNSGHLRIGHGILTQIIHHVEKSQLKFEENGMSSHAEYMENEILCQTFSFTFSFLIRRIWMDLQCRN